MHSTDMHSLIERLDDLVHNAKPVPLSDQVRLDKEEVYDILDEMRVTLNEGTKATIDEHVRASIHREVKEVRAALEGHPGRLPQPETRSTTISADAAAHSLSELLHRVKVGGEAFSIEQHGIPVAELRPPAG